MRACVRTCVHEYVRAYYGLWLELLLSSFYGEGFFFAGMLLHSHFKQ